MLLLLLPLLLASSVAKPQQVYYYPPAQPGSFYYMPQAALPSYQPLAPGGATPGQYVVLYTGYPSLPAHQSPVILRQEGGSSPGWWQTFIDTFGPKPPVIAPAEETDLVVEPGEEVTPSTATQEKPEKVVDEMMVAVEQNLAPRPAALEDLGEEEYGDGVDEETGVQPTRTPAVVAPTRKFVAVHEPQFFGNFDFLQRGQQEGQKESAAETLFRSQARPFPQLPPPFPYSHHQTPLLKTIHMHDALPAPRPQLRGAYIPGQRHVDVSHNVAPLQPSRASAPTPQEQEAIQILLPGLQDSSSQPGLQAFQNSPNQPGLINVGPGYQNVYFITGKQKPDDSQGIVVDANKMKKEESASSDNSTEVEEQAGPSVAQAKPQAIAIAGPGGVAAATPIATAVVGPGGLAVSAPTATAVAGPTGGGMLTGPAAAAVNKYLTNKKPLATDDVPEYVHDHRSVVAYSV